VKNTTDWRVDAESRKYDYWESYGDNEIFDGWTDDEDLQIAGDFLGRGYDQVMFISREPMDRSSPYFGNKARVIFADFSSGVPAEVIAESTQAARTVGEAA
jgi:hypothetical protein